MLLNVPGQKSACCPARSDPPPCITVNNSRERLGKIPFFQVFHGGNTSVTQEISTHSLALTLAPGRGFSAAPRLFCCTMHQFLSTAWHRLRVCAHLGHPRALGTRLGVTVGQLSPSGCSCSTPVPVTSRSGLWLRAAASRPWGRGAAGFRCRIS